MNSDPTGEFLIAALITTVAVVTTAVVVSGCSKNSNNSSLAPRSDLVSAPKLNRSNDRSSSYNCYGNAIGKRTVTNPSGYSQGDSTSKTYEAVKRDVGSNNIRRLNSASDNINSDENLVALKCGPMDYHFMVRVDNVWYNKPGRTPLIVNESLSIVTADKWVGRYVNNNGNFHSNPSIYYDDETIYFAIKKEWDAN